MTIKTIFLLSLSCILSPSLYGRGLGGGSAFPSDSLRTYAVPEIEVLSGVKENVAAPRSGVSATIQDRAALEARHATSLKEAAQAVPGLFIPDYGSRLTSAMYIRGVGSRAGTPAVALYVDNVPYIDKSAFDFRFYDVERVEVLRGPGATLYGRNAMGGVVNVYTRSPLAFQGTELTLGGATGDGHHSFALTHYHRPSPHFAFATGGYYEGSHGFFRNATTGRHVDGMKAGGGRLHAIYAPGRLRLDLSANYDYSDEGAYPYYYKGVAAGDEAYPDLVGLISSNRESRYRRGVLSLGLNAEYRFERWQANAVVGYQYLRDRMFMDQDFIRPDIYTLTQRQRISTLSAELTAKSRRPGRWQWLTGVSAVGQWLHTDGPVTFRADGMRWLASLINTAMPDLSGVPLLSAMGFGPMGVSFPAEEMLAGGDFSTPSTTLALFHRSTFSLTGRLALSVGARLDWERDAMDYAAALSTPYVFEMPNARMPQMSVSLPLSVDVGYTGSLADRHLRLLPKASLTYALSPGSSLYASVAMGQRSGGYNVQMFSDLMQGAMRGAMMTGVREGLVDYLAALASRVPAMPQTLPATLGALLREKMPEAVAPGTGQVAYRPERSWNYEVGAHLSLPAARLTLDGSAYLMTVSDQQISRFAPSGLGRMLVNAGRSRSVGGEAAVRWLPVGALTLSAAYGFTHAVFTDYDAGAGADYTRCRVPFVPKHTLSLGADCRLRAARPWPLGVRALTLGTDVSAAGRVYFTEDNRLSQPFYATLGAHVALETRDLTVRLWGRNLTASRYNTFAFVSAGRVFEQHAKPARVGIDVTLRVK